MGYSFLNACLVPMVYFLLIETAGHSVEEIDKWAEDNPGWLVHKVNLSSPSAVRSAARGDEESSPSEGGHEASPQLVAVDPIPLEETDNTLENVSV